MKAFRVRDTRLPVSLLCIVAILTSIGCTAFIPGAVFGQGRIIEVAVVDFLNTSKMPGKMFGKMATDAVVVELFRSGKFNVTSGDTLQAKMQELGYSVPLTPGLSQRLGQEVGANCVISGELDHIKIDKDKNQAEVRLKVAMRDVASGELVNGAIAVGRSYPHVGYTADEDKLLVEAISDAARIAVETMVQYILPEATVLSSVGTTEVLLNKGSQEGIEVGMEMIVLRRSEGGQDEVVGRVKVSRVTDTDSIATVIRAPKGVKPEDRVRAIFEMPSAKDVTSTQPPVRPSEQRKQISRGSRLAWAILGLLAIGALFKGGGDQPETVPGVTAQAGALPDINPHESDVGILITWNAPRNIGLVNIREFHVWRDNWGNPTSGGQGTMAPVLAPGVNTIGPVAGFDYGVVDEPSPRTVDAWHYPSLDHTTLEEADMSMSGITIGRPHRYYVSCVYQRVNPTTGNITYWETPPVAAGIATALNRPICQPITMGMGDLNDITFEWESSGGADTYCIEVSKSPNFERDVTWVYQFVQRTSMDGVLMSKTFTNVLRDRNGNLVPELQGIQNGDTLYWRVGARNSADRPGPIPAGPSPQKDGPKNTRYIYSLMEQFTVELPPSPPGVEDGGSDGGGTPPTPF
ncbi:MAG: hypothetical protein QHH26_11895 [Armatimonadota bacterium]|nr:hypothetical protein [Armatimonadota bacterium]